MNYSIKVFNGSVKSLRPYKEILPKDHVPITKAVYDDGFSQILQSRFLLFDENTGTFSPDTVRINTNNQIESKLEKRNALKALNQKIQFKTALGEDTTADQGQFENDRDDYNAQIAPA